MIARPLDDFATTTVIAPADSLEDMEATIRDFRAFMDDPVALLERAADLLRRKRNEVATYALFGVLAVHILAHGAAYADGLRSIVATG